MKIESKETITLTIDDPDLIKKMKEQNLVSPYDTDNLFVNYLLEIRDDAERSGLIENKFAHVLNK